MISRKKGGIELPSEMLTYLVRHCGDSVNDLINLLQQITVFALHGEREITQEVVDDLIRLCGVEPDISAQDYKSAVAAKGTKRTHAAGKSAAK